MCCLSYVHAQFADWMLHFGFHEPMHVRSSGPQVAALLYIQMFTEACGTEHTVM